MSAGGAAADACGAAGDPPYGGAPLPGAIRSGRVDNGNGLDMHVLEAGERGRPLVLLLHGFPELAYSWRKILPALAEAGFHAVAPDQRGYGTTVPITGDPLPGYECDLAPYRFLNLARDALGLVRALGQRSVAAVIGHDFGASVAAWCALVRPEVFRKVVLMSAPFAGPPALPFASALAGERRTAPASVDIAADLARLEPPRRHYHHYYASRAAEPEMHGCPQGVHAFLRAYFHMKSADRVGNRPHRLDAWSAAELAKLPRYYVMDRDRSMAAIVADEMPGPEAVAACAWLPDEELAAYSHAFARTGFQGGLNWYRARLSAEQGAELALFGERSIEVPAAFISGACDWGVFQTPGAFEAMRGRACTRMTVCELVDGAGHWVQQEQPAAVRALLVDFLGRDAS